MRKKKLIISLSVILAIIIALTVTSCVLFAPRKLSGLISEKGIVKIEFMDEVYNAETNEVKDVKYVLDESKYEDFFKAVRSTKYKIKYLKCRCSCPYEYVVYYENDKELHFSELRYSLEENGEVVKGGQINLNVDKFYNLFA